MTESETSELAGLREEIRALREEVRQLRAMLPAAQVHHHYPPAGWTGTVVHPGTFPQHQRYVSCAGAAGPAISTYTASAPANAVPVPLKVVDTSVAAGCAPVQICGVLP